MLGYGLSVGKNLFFPGAKALFFDSSKNIKNITMRIIFNSLGPIYIT